MQLCLSNLVDLALGQPHYLDCENFTFLHTLLHIILRKINLSNSRIELTDELAEKAENLMKLMPDQPSICLKEYMYREDGSKIKKRNSREICVKRSLTHVKNRWPKCGVSNGISSTTVKLDSPSVLPPLPNQSQMTSKTSFILPGPSTSAVSNKMNMNESVRSLTSKIENLFSELNERIVSMETELSELKGQNCEIKDQTSKQNLQNCAAFDDFLKLKNDFEKILPVIEKIRNAQPNLDIMKGKIGPSNCEVNVSLKEATRKNFNSGAFSEEEDETSTAQEDFIYLKEQVEELSESLELHSQCLKKLKCTDFNNLKNKVEEITGVIENVKVQGIEMQEMLKKLKGKDLVSVQKDIQMLKEESSSLVGKTREVNEKLDKQTLVFTEKLSALRCEPENNSNEKSKPSFTSSNRSSEHVIDSMNLLTDNEKTSKSATTFTNSVAKCSEDAGKCESFCSCPSLHVPLSQVDCRMCHEQKFDPSCVRELNFPQCAQGGFNGYPDRPGQDCCWDENGCTCNNCNPNYNPCNDGCPKPQPDCIDDLSNIQKQVSSHRFCLEQLIRDIAAKLDRSEFDQCRRQLNDTFDLVIKIRNEQLSPQTAAGCAIPLMQNVNCLSCQTTTNMMMTAEPCVPKAPALQFGRTGSNSTYNSSLRSRCRNISNSNWTCYTRNGRRAGGSHTKLPRVTEIREMRFKRLKTPIKVLSSLMVYKNRFTRNCY